MSISEAVRGWLLQPLLEQLKITEGKTMAQIDDLNAAVASLQTTVNTLGTDLTASIADLQAKLAAAIAAGTPPDLSGPIANITAIATQLTSLDSTSKGL
jgi:hypothetical protein